MKAFYFAFAVTALAAYASAGVVVQEEHPIGWYNCAGKPDGNYEHPSDCTRFISCSGGIASQRDCADCHIDAVRCPEGRTVYNASVDACLWADETTCQVSSQPSTTVGPLPTTGEPASTTGNAGSTAEPPITLPPIVNPPIENSTCDPLECKVKGYCQHYFKCDNTTTPPRWVRKECGTDLVFNPNDPSGNPHPHGGVCDYWSNLDHATNQTYRLDKECLRCFFEELGECSRDYDYQAPDLLTRTVQRLSCSAGLVFVEAEETCQRCNERVQTDGSTCEAECIRDGNVKP
ncbi:unnamed protein product [Orchesella dallaii]|uniref:Chitin-binding type-2 domain-containing protein n=1 Tax=Orchesella dallaii TaxID=48710 RepID=A0ABP1QDK5_9HEXA